MPAVTGAIAFLGALFLPATAGFVLSLAVGATILGVVTVAAVRTLGLTDQGELGGSAGISSHQSVVRSTVEPMRIVYGEALVSGPIWYMNSTGGEFRSMYVAIALTGHECESLVGVWLDDKYVPAADIDLLGSSGDGSVDADTNSHGYAPINSVPVLYLREHLGASTQVTDTMLDAAFADIGTNHRLRGRAYIVVRADKLEGADEVWQRGFPGNVSAVLRGKRVYDPRLDSTFTGSWGSGSGAHRVATPSTWAWSQNPALCLADYLLDSSLGVGIAAARIDYNSIAIAADICDASVSIPGSTTEARFRANGVLLTSDTHRRNIEKLLSSFDGTLRFVGGLYQVLTGSQTVAAALDESHLTGALRYQKQPNRESRYNAIRGTYLDASRRHKESQYLTVSDTTLASARDGGLTIHKDLDLPMTSGEYTAQRLAIRAVNKADLTGVLVCPTGYNGLALAVGDAITVTNDELGWSAKRFRVLGLRAVDLVGVEIMAQEDATTAYADPAVGDYGARTAAGTIEFPVVLPDIAAEAGQLVADPFFRRKTSFWLGQAADPDNYNAYTWVVSTLRGTATFEFSGAVVGVGVARLTLDGHASGCSASLHSLPRDGHLVVSGEYVVITCRIRRIAAVTPPSPDETVIDITAGVGSRLGSITSSSGSLAQYTYTQVAAWPLNTWQVVTGVMQLGLTTSAAQFAIAEVLLSGTAALDVEVESFTMQRAPSP